MHRFDKNSFSYIQKYRCTRFELPVGTESVLEAPIKKIYFIFYIMGKTLMGKKVENRNGGLACGEVQGFTTR